MHESHGETGVADFELLHSRKHDRGRHAPGIRNTAQARALLRQLRTTKRANMPIILWLLGVPLSLVIILALLGAF